MQGIMLIDEAHSKLRIYNECCLHYNLVAEGCYRKLAELGAPFSGAYFPYLVAVLIAFDMGRQVEKAPRTLILGSFSLTPNSPNCKPQ